MTHTKKQTHPGLIEMIKPGDPRYSIEVHPGFRRKLRSGRPNRAELRARGLYRGLLKPFKRSRPIFHQEP